jgi:hypothetical protein
MSEQPSPSVKKYRVVADPNPMRRDHRTLWFYLRIALITAAIAVTAIAWVWFVFDFKLPHR